MEILYKVHNNLYVNLTNKCPYACTFCLRQTMDRIGESDQTVAGKRAVCGRGEKRI